MATPLNELDVRARKKIGFNRIELFEDQAIGSGAFGAVCHAQCDDLPCAAKIFHLAIFAFTGQHTFLTRFEQECELICAVQHPNIIQHFGVHYDDITGEPALLMELMDDNLSHYLESSPCKISYHLQVNFCRDVALALSFLHSNSIIHRNLSGNNVLVSNVRAKVSDFGMTRLSDLASHLTHTMSPLTHPYMPPEAFKKGLSKNADKIDCFSFGVIAVQIMTQKFPNPVDHRSSLGSENSIAYKIIPEMECRENHISMIDPNHPLLPITYLCLSDDSTQRPSAQTLCKEMKNLQESGEYYESLTNKDDKSAANQRKLIEDIDTNASILEHVHTTEGQQLLDEKHCTTTELPKSEVILVAAEVYPTENEPSSEHASPNEIHETQECNRDNAEQVKQESMNDATSALDKQKGLEIVPEQDDPRQKHDSAKTNESKKGKKEHTHNSASGAEPENEITVLSTEKQADHSDGAAMRPANSSEEKGKKRKRIFALFRRRKKSQPKMDTRKGSEKKRKAEDGDKKKSKVSDGREKSRRKEREIDSRHVKRKTKRRYHFKRRRKHALTLMIGLDGVGKTTTLYKLKLGETVTTIPTIGVNPDTIEYGNMEFTVWDIGGQDKIRPLWRHHFTGTEGLIWVTDSAERDRTGEDREEFHRVINDDEMRDAVILVFANKQDLPNAMTPAEVSDNLGLHRLRDRDWHIQGSCATAGYGLYEGLDWLKGAIKRNY